MPLRVSIASDVGRWRRRNEDACWATQLSPGIWALAVADGMGGQRAGDVASGVAIDTLKSSLTPEAAGQAREPATLLRRAMEEANRRIVAMGRERGELSGMGTTLTAALVLGRHAWLGHVGDSRAYLVREHTIRQITNDHSFVGELLRDGALDEAGAMRHPQRNLITRALGVQVPLEMDLHSEALRRGDVLILASDGLTSLVAAADLVEAVAETPPHDFAVIAHRLVSLANDRGGYDNITALLALVADDAAEGTAGETLAAGRGTA